MILTGKDELQKYLEDAIAQETAIVQQEKMIAEYNALSFNRKPIQQTVDKPKPPQRMTYVFPSGLIGLCILLIVACLILFVVGYPGVLRANHDIDACEALLEEGTNSYNQDELAEAQREKETFTMVTTLGRLCLVGGVSILCYGAYQENKLSQEYDKESSAYRSICQQIDSRNYQFAIEYQQAMDDWNISNEEMNTFMRKPLLESQNLLQRYYSSNIIYAKYRTIPALTSMYEYFITGRCTELTGPHGAYNMYEDELRKDTVISQLNTVIENLEQIKQNQYMLYQQVKAIQENTSQIASELRQIKGHTVQIAQLTALNAYYAALNERNTRITMYYHL